MSKTTAATHRAITPAEAEAEGWYTPNQNNGYCECGCGEPAPIAEKTDRRRGHVKGQLIRFRPGHYFRSPEHLAYLRSPEHLAHLAKARASRKNALPLRDRIAAKVVIDPDTGCHLWQGGTSAGYGMVYVEDERMTQAHRAAYEVEHGPLPEGTYLHHTCRNPLCCRPAHLLPVTPKSHRAAHREEDAIVEAIQAGETFEDAPAADAADEALDSVGALSREEVLALTGT